METDREVLMWLHERFVHVHKESRYVDYIRRLRWIIAAQSPTKQSRGNQYPECCNNSLKDIGAVLKQMTLMEKQMVLDSEL